MGLDALFVIVLLGAGFLLFVTERIPVELSALLLLTALLISGVVTLEQGLSGFSNPATIAVAAMFVLSTGLYKTGALNPIGLFFSRVGSQRPTAGLFAMMCVIALVSAFINNTAAMAIFLPVALSVSADSGVSPSKWLIPLSFASMFGGMCTLIGTSTNLLISSITKAETGIELGMFEFAQLGLVFVGAGILYLTIFSSRLLPDRRAPEDLTSSFGLAEYLTEIVLLDNSRSIGSTIRDAPLTNETDVEILDIIRGETVIAVPHPSTILRAGDILKIRCNAETINILEDEQEVALRPHTQWTDQDLFSEQAELVEAVISPSSMMVGRSIKSIRFRNLFGATVLALRHRGRLLREELADTRLSGGDTLLLEVRTSHLAQLRGRRDFVIVSDLGLPIYRSELIPVAAAIVALVVVLAAANLVPITVSALGGCVVMVLSGCLTVEEAYRAIEWKVVLLLAGLLPMGIALESSGVAAQLSSFLVSSVGEIGGPLAVLSALYLLTSVLTEIISNNATAVLLAPVAIGAGLALGVSPLPFLMAVTFAASASFMTPIGYQTNMMIFEAGRYRFSDFLKIGIPLNLLFWVIATIMIPKIWPF